MVNINLNTTQATALPVIQKHGTLQQNETWTSGYVYLITNTLTVPDGITLNIEEGAVVKYQNYYAANISINSNGTLNVTGTANNPVTFTSYRDGSVGGDSNGDGPSSGANGDYNTAIFGYGGTVHIEHAEFKYGWGAIGVNDSETSFKDVTMSTIATAVSINGGKSNFANTVISNSSDGLVVNGNAQVVFRGSFSNISGKAIRSCNWGGGPHQACAVDAAYVDWGAANGPIPSSGNALVCGRVAVSPWLYGGVQHDSGVFGSKNCDGSPAAPQVNLQSNITYFQQRVSLRQIDCSNGFQDACDAINTAMACLGGAMSVVQSQLPWPLPPATNSQEVAAFGGLVIDGASTYLTSQATPSVVGFSFGLIGQLVGTVATMNSIGNAYSSCAP